VAVASAKSAPRFRQTTTPASTTQFVTGRMPFLLPNQQRQSTEGTDTLMVYFQPYNTFQDAILTCAQNLNLPHETNN